MKGPSTLPGRWRRRHLARPRRLLPTVLMLPALARAPRCCSGLVPPPGCLNDVRSVNLRSNPSTKCRPAGGGRIGDCEFVGYFAKALSLHGNDGVDRSDDAHVGSGRGDGGGDDSILEELEELARYQLPRRAELELEEGPARFPRRSLVPEEEGSSDTISTTGVPWIAVGMLGGAACFVWAVFALTHVDAPYDATDAIGGSDAGGAASADEGFLDWKDLAAYTAGEAFSSSVLRAALYVGELSLLRSVFGGARKSEGDSRTEPSQARWTEMTSGPSEDNVGIVDKLVSWVEEQGDDFDDVDWADVLADVGTWVLYACLKDDSPGRVIAAIDSALESAALGLASSVAALLLTEVVVARTEWLTFADDSKEKIRQRDGRGWIAAYLRAGLSASALFFVYDLIMRLLGGGALLK